VKNSEKFHQDLKVIEERWNKHMLADYCWLLKRDEPHAVYSRKSRKRYEKCDGCHYKNFIFLK